MINSRYLLLLFGLAFLAIQVVSFYTNITGHDEELKKLDKMLIQVENGSFFDLKIDPQVSIIKENNEFRNSIIGFAVKVIVITGATILVYFIILRNIRKVQS